MESIKNVMFKLILLTVLLTIAPGSSTAQDCIQYEDYIHWAGEAFLEGVYYDHLAKDVAVYGDYAYMSGVGLYVFDISDPHSPHQIWRDEDVISSAITVAGDLAYAADDHFYVFSLEDPARPRQIGYLFDFGNFNDIEEITVAGDLAFMTGLLDDDLFIIDVANPRNPQLLCEFDLPRDGNGVAVGGDIAYVTSDYDLFVVDVSDPSAPVLLHTMELGGCCTQKLDISGDHLYIADYLAGLRVVDIADPLNPTTVCRLDTAGHVNAVKIRGGLAYLSLNGGLSVIDISQPEVPVPLGIIAVAGSTYNLDLAGDLVCMPESGKGLQIIDATSVESAPVIGTMENFDGYDVAVDGPLVQIAGYIPFLFKGLKIYDASDPSAPVEIGKLETPWSPQDMAVSGDITFLAMDGDLQVVDTSDPTQPEQVGVFVSPGEVQGVDLAGDLAVLADYWEMEIIDVSDPANPGWVSWLDTPGQNQDVTVASDFAYLTLGDDGFWILDISDPANPIVAAEFPNSQDDLPLHAHKFFVSQQDGHAYLADTAGLYIYDVSDPYHPVRVGMFDGPGDAQSVVVLGDIAYVAGGKGLQIVDITDRSAPVHLGTADTGLDLRSCYGLTLANGIIYLASEVGCWIFPQQCASATPVGGPLPGPRRTALGPIYPNPFNPRTRIDFTVDRPQRVNISVFDLAGREVAVLTDRLYRAGGYELDWFGRDGAGRPVASGVYLVNLKAGELTESRKVMLAR